jgi:bacteriophage N4 adsorption protein B
MPPDPSQLLVGYQDTLAFLTAAVALVMLVLGLDDLFIDIWYWCRELLRTLTVRRHYKPLTAAQLYERDEQPIAIMIPAWLEHDVIAPMLENMVVTLDYREYAIFVGTYVNDKATIDEVERMRRRFRQLVRVEVPHDGPTCKADCLNWIVQAIFSHERSRGVEFAGVVLHDCEDVLHPMELKLFNYILPRKDLIQIPVASLERNWHEFVAGTYMDEFAEWHARDLVVRESLSGMVPSAGVGTCFSRHALTVLAAETDNQPFNTDTLTEDYDIGARLMQHGMKLIFCLFPVDFIVQRKSWFGLGHLREVRVRMPLCVREYFPSTFRTAYRQKARWTLGICFQGWQQVGWSGSLATKYLLFRDRKGVVTPFINIFGYLLTAQLLPLYIMTIGGFWAARLSAPVWRDWIVWLLYANGALLLWRASQRIYFVHRIYGWEHALLALPRLVVGNFVNFAAVVRAWKLFLVHLMFHTRITWDKTAHDFPSSATLSRRRQRLGELLLTWRAVDDAKLASALDLHRNRGTPLGRILVSEGSLDEETVAEAIAFQAAWPRAHPSAEQIAQAAGMLPINLCVRWRIVPFGVDASGRVMVATAGPVAEEARQAIAALLPHQPSWHIVRESEIAAAMRLMRRHGVAADVFTVEVPLLGDILLEMDLVHRDVLATMLARYHPDRDGRIGDFLVAHSVVTREAVQTAADVQQRLAIAAEASAEGGT